MVFRMSSLGSALLSRLSFFSDLDPFSKRVSSLVLNGTARGVEFDFFYFFTVKNTQRECLRSRRDRAGRWTTWPARGRRRCTGGLRPAPTPCARLRRPRLLPLPPSPGERAFGTDRVRFLKAVAAQRALSREGDTRSTAPGSRRAAYGPKTVQPGAGHVHAQEPPVLWSGRVSGVQQGHGRANEDFGSYACRRLRE